MKNKYRKYRKYVFLLDRFPYIVFILVAGLAIILFLNIDQRLDLGFFSSPAPEANQGTYNVYVSSPEEGQIFNFWQEDEIIPIEIIADQIEDSGFDVAIIINGQVVDVLTSPPYEYDWVPQQEGEYQLVVEVADQWGQLVAQSDSISFEVNYLFNQVEGKAVNEDIEAKKASILAQQYYRAENDAAGRPMFSYKCYSPPIIDANIEEWAAYEKFSSFVPTIKKANYTGPEDSGGTFYSSWDESNFYFAIQVVDDVLNQNFTGGQLINGDSVVIVLDTNLKQEQGIKPLNSNNFQIEFSPGNFSDLDPEIFVRWPGNSSPQDSIIYSAKWLGGYIIEASISWENFLNYTPSDGDILGFTVSILDTDNLQSTELVISSSNKFDFNDVSTLGNLVLMDAGDIAGQTEA